MDDQTSTLILSVLAVVGTLLGAALTGWFTLRNGKLQTSRDKQSWLRQQRLAVYSELVEATTSMRPYYMQRADQQVWSQLRNRKEFLDAARAYGHALNRAALVTPPEEFKPVRLLANRWMDEVMMTPGKTTRETIFEIHGKMRDELAKLLLADADDAEPQRHWWRVKTKNLTN